ncbi:polysaccharide lyase family 14 protein [Paxillus rubicundulus Ve08.2h10]|uniref:Polysaccharide lyase family 14 protein n=1 Tax=Paxillus rubicundulus Ve08.2h10 TaxID=930991 RepID=A0A0D0DUT7_9AGAM|nr:polysaccharide lyase family 14 protein [Paxillus rubicundulus Ve08.2h10]
MADGLVSPASLAAQYSLTTSTTMPFPTATQASTNAQSFITSQWSLSLGHIQNGESNIAFVDDPFPNDPTPGSPGDTSFPGPVLQVTYPAGSYSEGSGGAQWYSLWNTTDGSSFNSMVLSYEIAFDSSFQWVQGGKLPGLRGGSDVYGCSGGVEPNGSDCFSTRLMWRKNGAGEVYAYMLTPNNICSENNILCNSDYGVSISRGSFSFASGQWSRVTLLVQMNNPPDVANGNLVFYFNDVLALTQSNLQFRSATDVDIGGIFFSTFFGGSDSSWATPETVHTYYRNFQLFGSSSASTLAGATVSGAVRLTAVNGLWTVALFLASLITYVCL